MLLDGDDLNWIAFKDAEPQQDQPIIIATKDQFIFRWAPVTANQVFQMHGRFATHWIYFNDLPRPHED